MNIIFKILCFFGIHKWIGFVDWPYGKFCEYCMLEEREDCQGTYSTNEPGALTMETINECLDLIGKSASIKSPSFYMFCENCQRVHLFNKDVHKDCLAYLRKRLENPK